MSVNYLGQHYNYLHPLCFQIASEEHWPGLRILILVVSARLKIIFRWCLDAMIRPKAVWTLLVLSCFPSLALENCRVSQ